MTVPPKNSTGKPRCCRVIWRASLLLGMLPAAPRKSTSVELHPLPCSSTQPALLSQTATFCGLGRRAGRPRRQRSARRSRPPKPLVSPLTPFLPTLAPTTTREIVARASQLAHRAAIRPLALRPPSAVDSAPPLALACHIPGPGRTSRVVCPLRPSERPLRAQPLLSSSPFQRA